MKRIEKKFLDLKAQKQCAFVAYICAGDPDYKTSLEVLKALPKAGVDIIELGVPFLDPSGDGPIIENAAKRAITNGMTLRKTLEMAAEFRKTNQTTPLVLMSYYNPILKFGLNEIFLKTKESGIDAILIVDLPMEEEEEILKQLHKTNLDLIRLIAPTTEESRSRKIAKNAGGFLYLISMLGITGTRSADISENKNYLKKLRRASDLPIAIGFGIKTPKQAGEFSKIGSDGVIIGSTIVSEINESFLAKKSPEEIVTLTIKKVREFAKEIKK